MQKLNKDFYLQKDVAFIAKALLGKIIVTKFNKQFTAARIVETEAYAGIVDKASHAWNGRRTQRTEIMFGEGGTAYVYLCYGIHHMFNIVTNELNVPDAVLIRGVQPLEGIDIMLQRFNRSQQDTAIGRGPGNVGKALGIFTMHSGASLSGRNFFIAGDGTTYDEVMVSKRIGVDYAGAHAQWLYRFFVKGHPQVTKHNFNKTAVQLL
jgi:DNA-3-methyladenine glycosylase